MSKSKTLEVSGPHQEAQECSTEALAGGGRAAHSALRPDDARDSAGVAPGEGEWSGESALGRWHCPTARVKGSGLGGG